MMPDMDKIEWEDYAIVVLPNQFLYDRPKSSKVNKKKVWKQIVSNRLFYFLIVFLQLVETVDTEKLHRVRILKKVPFIDENGVEQREVCSHSLSFIGMGSWLSLKNFLA